MCIWKTCFRPFVVDFPPKSYVSLWRRAFPGDVRHPTLNTFGSSETLQYSDVYVNTGYAAHYFHINALVICITCLTTFVLAGIHLKEVLIFFGVGNLHLIWWVHIHRSEKWYQLIKQTMHYPPELANISPNLSKVQCGRKICFVSCPLLIFLSLTPSIIFCKKRWNALLRLPKMK